MEEAIALDSIQAIAASFGASFDAEKIIDTVLEKVTFLLSFSKYGWIYLFRIDYLLIFILKSVAIAS